ncbi:pyruvate kinase [Sporichthya sp.]|uniref:pyruvate kinase n=1 Tax=Sporichthya sp. TaxID=65475 RepID=UPI0017C2D383|nr:pyruvate kinase [Sporichthya sp.]MBA3745352.1 pyruvate kinase [Sporichthya sp.]
MRRAKIICTLGPATDSEDQVRALVAAGMDIARLNLSHGEYAEHEERYRKVRAASDALGRAVGILVDLQGPKIRLGRFADGSAELLAGAPFTITTRDVPGDAAAVSTTYPGLPRDCEPGDAILVDDGRIGLQVLSVTGTDVNTLVVDGGWVSNSKGLNLPGVAVGVPALSEKDIADLRWALHLRADMIALSFVRDAKDYELVRAIMDEEGVVLPVIAKLEKPQAVENLDEIIAAFDGVMVARGDLGVELPLEDVPLVQKRAIHSTRIKAKPVIVATQMLDSMIEDPRPTRAEASDVANAVLDGADALMLSGETSVGRHALTTVRTMARIIEAVEEDTLTALGPAIGPPQTIGGAIARAATEVGEAADAKYLVAFTQSGQSARRLARYRSPIPVLAFTPVAAVRNQLALSWGVETFLVPEVRHTDEMVKQVDATLLELGRVQVGDRIVIIAGSPPGIPGSTNAMRVHRMGDAVNLVVPAYDSD